MQQDLSTKTPDGFFNYKTVFNGHFANTYATDVFKYSAGNVTKISTIDDYAVYACKFIDENVGYIIANTPNNTMPATTRQAILMKTSDGGITWSTPVTISDSYSGSTMFRLNDGKLIVPIRPSETMSKDYFVSNDDGETWYNESVPANQGIRDMFILPSGVGYLKTGLNGLWSSENVGEVFKTTDGGTTWAKIKGQINGSTVWFYDENIGYLQDLIYGKGQILYVTRDGGVTWKEILFPYDYLIE